MESEASAVLRHKGLGEDNQRDYFDGLVHYLDRVQFLGDNQRGVMKQLIRDQVRQASDH